VKFKLYNKASFIFQPSTVTTKIYILPCAQISFEINTSLIQTTGDPPTPRGPTAPLPGGEPHTFETSGLLAAWWQVIFIAVLLAMYPFLLKEIFAKHPVSVTVRVKKT
jgi:hypothetical protein